MSINAQNRLRLGIVLALTSSYMIIEIIGSILTNSLALMSDAVHMLSDVGGLSMSLFASFYATKPPTPKKSFGYYRIEILVALFNGLILIALVAYIFFEAHKRFLYPPEVLGLEMLIIALIGLVVNLTGARILWRSSKESLNLRSAFLHVIMDALGSIGAITSGAIIFLTGLKVADPIASVAIGLIMMPTIYRLMKGSVNILMESAPEHISPKEVEEVLLGIEGVEEVHHLHLWTITSGIYSISAHLTIDRSEDWCCILEEARKILKERFKIVHSTIQIEDKERHKLHVNEESNIAESSK
ncbi:MAG: cation transporter [archaeon]|nr:cation transporter [archaeon]MCP8313795.1 cation transporter [archaeon]MCP8316386.1 cation transporter [archaeon]MCP8322131.1 cation transporter [archaeon]